MDADLAGILRLRASLFHYGSEVAAPIPQIAAKLGGDSNHHMNM
jgi:hypothetical protein